MKKKILAFTVFMVLVVGFVAVNVLVSAPKIEKDIKTRVSKTLKKAGYGNIAVSVDGRNVALKGTVDSLAAKLLVMKEAEDELGVRDVAVNIQVVEKKAPAPKEIIKTIVKYVEKPQEKNIQVPAVISDIFRLYFYFNTAKLKPGYEDKFAELMDFVKKNPDYKFEISGHTDVSGNVSVNQKLSKHRAKFVYDKIIENGIDPKRITYKGNGSDNPLFNNNSKLGRKLNRRIELSVKKVN
jgi:outer membrane protein OmpA-like peptidoglycan-associated protein